MKIIFTSIITGMAIGIVGGAQGVDLTTSLSLFIIGVHCTLILID